MATRLEEILVRARDTLADPNQERWLDAQLIRLADDAHKSLVEQTSLLRTKFTVPIADGQELYTLPTNIHQISRVLDGSFINLPLLSHEQADIELGIGWEQTIGAPTHVIFDKLAPNDFKLYPIPTNVPVGVVTPLATQVGVTSSGTIEASGFSSPYGVVTGFLTTPLAQLTIYGTLKATTIVLPTDLLESPDVYDRAIKFYITGMALRDDKDVQNRQMGAEELQFWQIELRKAIKDASENFSGATTQYDTQYTGGI